MATNKKVKSEIAEEAYFAPSDAREEAGVKGVSFKKHLREKYSVITSWRGVTAGAYPCTVTDVSCYVDDDGEYTSTIMLDIAEGEYAGVFSKSDVQAWAHSTKYRMEREYSFDRFIKDIDAIEKSNPGFNAEEAFYEDRFDDFVGKRVGAIFCEREYENKYGEVSTALNITQLIPVAEVEDTPAPAIQRLRKGRK